MKKLFYLFSIALFVLLGCSDDDATAGASSYNMSLKAGEYQAVIETQVDYYKSNFSGQLVYVKSEIYSYNGSLFIDPPEKVGTISESNPFNLMICTESSSNNRPGCFWLWSATLVDGGSGSVLLQYWDFDYNAGNIEGTFIKTGLDEAYAAFNTIWTEDEESIPGLKMVTPYVFAENETVMYGTINNNSASIVIEGVSTNAVRVFKTVVNASR
ncbi:MAG: hypothetical protein ACLFQU_03695 [Candidatus Kapaibacterium sp.]